MKMNRTDWLVITVVVVAVTVLCVLGFWGLPTWNVWRRELSGQAQLAEAEWSKKITIEEAAATLESSTLLAKAEVERAKGVAEANEIIGVSLRENEAYLRYLWIQGLHDGSSEIIYVPTEANLPILEATRRLAKPTETPAE